MRQKCIDKATGVITYCCRKRGRYKVNFVSELRAMIVLSLLLTLLSLFLMMNLPLVLPLSVLAKETSNLYTTSDYGRRKRLRRLTRKTVDIKSTIIFGDEEKQSQAFISRSDSSNSNSNSSRERSISESNDIHILESYGVHNHRHSHSHSGAQMMKTRIHRQQQQEPQNEESMHPVKRIIIIVAIILLLCIAGIITIGWIVIFYFRCKYARQARREHLQKQMEQKELENYQNHRQSQKHNDNDSKSWLISVSPSKSTAYTKNHPHKFNGHDHNDNQHNYTSTYKNYPNYNHQQQDHPVQNHYPPGTASKTKRGQNNSNVTRDHSNFFPISLPFHTKDDVDSPYASSYVNVKYKQQKRSTTQNHNGHVPPIASGLDFEAMNHDGYNDSTTTEEHDSFAKELETAKQIDFHNSMKHHDHSQSSTVPKLTPPKNDVAPIHTIDYVKDSFNQGISYMHGLMYNNEIKHYNNNEHSLHKALHNHINHPENFDHQYNSPTSFFDQRNHNEHSNNGDLYQDQDPDAILVFSNTSDTSNTSSSYAGKNSSVEEDESSKNCNEPNNIPFYKRNPPTLMEFTVNHNMNKKKVRQNEEDGFQVMQLHESDETNAYLLRSMQYFNDNDNDEASFDDKSGMEMSLGGHTKSSASNSQKSISTITSSVARKGFHSIDDDNHEMMFAYIPREEYDAAVLAAANVLDGTGRNNVEPYRLKRDTGTPKISNSIRKLTIFSTPSDAEKEMSPNHSHGLEYDFDDDNIYYNDRALHAPSDEMRGYDHRQLQNTQHDNELDDTTTSDYPLTVSTGDDSEARSRQRNLFKELKNASIFLKRYEMKKQAKKKHREGKYNRNSPSNKTIPMISNEDSHDEGYDESLTDSIDISNSTSSPESLSLLKNRIGAKRSLSSPSSVYKRVDGRSSPLELRLRAVGTKKKLKNPQNTDPPKSNVEHVKDEKNTNDNEAKLSGSNGLISSMRANRPVRPMKSIMQSKIRKRMEMAAQGHRSAFTPTVAGGNRPPIHHQNSHNHHSLQQKKQMQPPQSSRPSHPIAIFASTDSTSSDAKFLESEIESFFSQKDTSVVSASMVSTSVSEATSTTDLHNGDVKVIVSGSRTNHKVQKYQKSFNDSQADDEIQSVNLSLGSVSTSNRLGAVPFNPNKLVSAPITIGSDNHFVKSVQKDDTTMESENKEGKHHASDVNTRTKSSSIDLDEKPQNIRNMVAVLESKLETGAVSFVSMFNSKKSSTPKETEECIERKNEKKVIAEPTVCHKSEGTMESIVSPTFINSRKVLVRDVKEDPQQQQASGDEQVKPTIKEEGDNNNNMSIAGRISPTINATARSLISMFESRKSPSSTPIIPQNEYWQYTGKLRSKK